MTKRDRKLTDEQVREIRSNPVGTRAMARHYGVSPKTIRSVRSGEVYRFVGNYDSATQSTDSGGHTQR